MKLTELLSGVEVRAVAGDPAIDAGEVRDDSREVRPGDLFAAVPGTRADGHAFVADAAARGAAAVVADRDIAFPGTVIRVPDVRRALALIAANRFGRPAEGLRLCGVTGTNGKTTTTYLVESILAAAGFRPGVSGTVANRIRGVSEPAALTTPGPLALHRWLRRLRDAGGTHAVMEVSSHALDQNRVEGLRFAAAGFSNLTRDHLDHHGTMEAYRAAKARLFERHLAPDGVAVLNADDSASEAMAAAASGSGTGRRVLRVSAAGDPRADLRVLRWATSVAGLEAEVATPSGPLAIRSPLAGAFNLDNVLLAAGLAFGLGLAGDAIARGVAGLRGVPGRLESVPNARGLGLFVDYAHTPDALARVLAVLRPICRGRLIAVFGCGGDRDRTKRPLMGEAAARGADLAIVTSDNPRSEDPRAIIAEIEPGLAGVRHEAIPDRREAIAAALGRARAGDVVLVAGKGHEDYQIVGATRLPFSDRAEIERILRAADPPSGSAASPGAAAPDRRPVHGIVASSASSGPPPPLPDLAGQRVVVIGLGRSGVAAAKLALARGARVTVNDRRPAGELVAALAALPGGCHLDLGGHREDLFRSADLVVLSPGVPPLPAVEAARAAGVRVTGELEFASWFVEAPVVAVTGTNGKSTTTALAGALLAPLGRPLFVGGNLGTPLSEAAGTPAAGAGGLAVVEASSFQLETVERFHARAAVFLNLTEDHFDRHGTMEAYGEAKARIFANQTPEDLAVVNAEDPWCRRLAERTPAAVLEFSSARTLARGGFLDGGDLVLRGFGTDERYPAAELAIVGRHNHENALAALLVARWMGVPAEAARVALAAFRPLHHRLEKVAEGRGLVFYDDSKATNVHSVVKALEGFPLPVVLIAGGRDKGGDYAPLREAARGRVRAAVLIGEAQAKIAAALGDVVPVVAASAMDDAVRKAAALARRGDAVVLSPACASFDMFRNYEHRGQAFREAAAAWSAEAAST